MAGSNVVRRDVVQIGFDIDNSELSSLLDNLDGLQREIRDLSRSNGVEDVTDGLDDADREARDLIDSVEDVTDGLDDAGEAAEDIADGAKEADKAIDKCSDSAGGLTSALKGALGVVAGLATGFLATAEIGQEFTEDMGKLEAGFLSAGHTAETAQASYEGMVGILGETDQSVEAVNHLARLTKSEEELAAWTDIAAGIYGTFGDSLPIEGLTEAANETAKVGQVTGPLADALNWAGISEDKFNKQLEKCNSEAERATLITETLTKTYQEAADIYKETNADLIAARKATSDMNAAIAEMGRIAMPIMTLLKGGFTDLINVMLPGLEKVGDGITGLLNGTEGSAELLESGLESVFDGLLGTITEKLPVVLNIGVQLITSLAKGIVNAIPSLVSAILSALPQVINAIIEITQALITGLTQAAPEILSGLSSTIYVIIDTIAMAAPDLLQAAIDFFVAIAQALPNVLTDIIEGLDAIIADICYGLIEAMPELMAGAETFFTALIDALPIVLEHLIAYIPIFLEAIIEFLTTSIPILLQAAINLFNAILEALPVIITELLAALPELIKMLQVFFEENFPVLIDAAITLFMALVEALPEVLDALISALPDIIAAVVDFLILNLPVVIKGAVDLFMALVKAIPKIIPPLIAAIPQIISAIIQGLSPFGAEIDNVFRGAWNKVKGIFSDAGQFFSGVLNSITGAFSSVGSWFSEKFTEAVDSIKSAFSTVGEFFTGIWETIKGIFTEIGTTIGNGIGDAFATVVNSIIGFAETTINGFIRSINNAIELINEIPGVEISKVSELSIPRLAEGGIVDRPTIAQIGEDGKEAIVPLENNLEWINKVVRGVTSAFTGSKSYEKDVVSSTKSEHNEYNEYKPTFVLNMNGASATDDNKRKVKQWIREAMKEMFDDLDRDNAPILEI